MVHLLAEGMSYHQAIKSPESLKICVIGGGAAGLAALKVIKDSHQFQSGNWDVFAFESRQDVGGVWLPAPPTGDPPLTPLYDSLTTNLPHPLMAYPSFLFPNETNLYPKAQEVLAYLKRYAEEFELMRHIMLNVSVTSVTWTGASWVVKTTADRDGVDCDRIIVANGHYRVPFFPPIPGLQSWIHHRKVTHSAWYRSPHFVGDVVLVVGGGPSGQDLTHEMSTVCKTVVHSVPGTQPTQSGNIKLRSRVVRFSESDSSVTFEDGTSEAGIDHVFLATGYLTSFPFFSEDVLVDAVPPPVPPLPQHAYNSSQHVFPLALDLFPLQADFPVNSVAFMGLPIKVVPFPLCEAQARAAVKAFSDPSAIDPAREAVAIVSRYEALMTECAGDGERVAHAWFRYRNQEQFDYRDALHAFAGLTDEKWKVRAWEKWVYEKKDVLRKSWRMLEESGQSSEWLKGVGEGGIEDWVNLMERLAEHFCDVPIEGTEAKL
ncbi:FAD/NAD(P)-binding domain-containing protein [Schizopora paradoxa]|uniref:FAD/NAD(P)-binding domain-containing protein n=1 Tax=Schizopora paradoxa TaxID=27342 RepID=A0A0H2RNY9_9AGAM|nr:FAD/NAD(P)-binding domain-containing protein [Schizopora paradoxa]